MMSIHRVTQPLDRGNVVGRFVGDDSRYAGRGQGDHIQTGLGEPALDLGVGHDQDESRLEAFQNLGRNAGTGG